MKNEKLFNFVFSLILGLYKVLELLDENRTKMITKKFLEKIKTQEAE